MGPLERLIGSLIFFIYIGRKRRREEKKGSRSTPKFPKASSVPPQSLAKASPETPKACPKLPKASPKPPQMLRKPAQSFPKDCQSLPKASSTPPDVEITP